MEVRFSEALPLNKVLRSVVPSDARQRGEEEQIAVMPSRFSEAVSRPLSVLEQDEQNNPFDRSTAEELVKRSAELLSLFDRELKYEMQDDAGVMQMQVIDSRDGRVVRKVPADEVIKFIEQIKAQIDDRIDVLA